jgi:hypothetical protein
MKHSPIDKRSSDLAVQVDGAILICRAMCGRVIQSSSLLNYEVVKGMNVRDSRVHNYPPRWNAAPSHELLAW